MIRMLLLRPRLLRLIHRLLGGLLGGLLLSGCAPSLNSIRETAALGGRVGDLSSVLSHGPRYCSLQEAGYRAALGPTDRSQIANCEELKVADNARIMLRGSGLVAV